ncbi:serine hydrolase [Nesterenkonia alba]|uniref:serine hydrolase n=1 Tax=Nesterenkonia alba TaxID=515814 RepID=UPI0003B33235|nr:serine hydrolase [Nesterenkonia alba]
MTQPRGSTPHRTRGILSARQWLALALAGVLVVVMAVQLLYPWDRSAPFAQVDGVDVGSATSEEITETLESAYLQTPVPVHFSGDNEPLVTPTFAELGGQVDVTAQVEQLQYRWLRAVPTSLLWAGRFGTPTAPQITVEAEDFARQTFGQNCQAEPVNATIEPAGDQVTAVGGQSGWECDLTDVATTLAEQAHPAPEAPEPIQLDLDPIAPEISDEEAEQLAATINSRLPAELTVDGQTLTLPSEAVVSWLSVDEQLEVTVDSTGELTELLTTEGVLQNPPERVFEASYGVLDVVEGTATDIDAADAEAQLAEYLTTAEDPAEIVVTTETVQAPDGPLLRRSMAETDPELDEVIATFAEENIGTYGVSLIELDGEQRRATYQPDEQFIAASTYKTWLSYSTILREEADELQWDDHLTGGRTLAECFEDMIVESDNPCAEYLLLDHIGREAVEQEAEELGAQDTSFSPPDLLTTADDLSWFMARLATGEVEISSAGQTRLIEAMGRNIYRDGIPAGSTGEVMNKVGFLEGPLHDTAIVEHPEGTYILTVLTEGASWEAIADLTRELEEAMGLQ